MGTNLLNVADYTKYVDRDNYQIWKIGSSDTAKKRLIAIYKDIAVTYQRSTAKILYQQQE